jgi:hypothetical protein
VPPRIGSTTIVALGSAETTREPLFGATGTFLLTTTVRVFVTYCVLGRLGVEVRGALLPPLKFVRDAPPTMSCALAVRLVAMPTTASNKVAMNLCVNKNLMSRTSREGARENREKYSKGVGREMCRQHGKSLAHLTPR